MVSMKTARTRRAMMGIRLAVVAFVLAAFSAIGSAQTGRLKGKVVDAGNKPVEGATVTIESQEMNRKVTTKTDRRGEYTHFLAPGPYKVTVTKDNLSQMQETRVSIDERELNFTLSAATGGGGGAASDAERKKVEAENAAIKAAFAAGATAINEGRLDEAITKFSEVITKIPNCAECFLGIGNAHMKKKEFEQAEAAYKKAVAANANSAEAYMGLANAYSAQRKSDLAMEASASAQKLLGQPGAAGAPGGGASAGAVFNQGVIAWNASKIPEAQKLFEQAVALDPKLADAHYWLGMANVNQGKLPEAAKSFEEYLKLDPKGQYAEQAKGILSQIKK